MQRYVLYGMPASLYTAKARSYLRKQRIDHVERVAGDPRYTGEVLPRIGRWIIPVLQTPAGELIQDTVDIIDHFEADSPPGRSAYPATPLQRCVAHVLELFGGEGLLRPAMHYRWDFDETNLEFLSRDFGLALAPSGTEEERARVFAAASERMRRATRSVGVTDATATAIEGSYERFLSLLDAHLATAPYLLGGRPTIGDFGFIAPLYAHLARDPYPSLLMKRGAGRVWRWVERMNAPVMDAGEFPDDSEMLFHDDTIPETLRALLRYVSEELVPELLAHVAFIDRWLDGHEHELNEGDVVGGAPHRRRLGVVTVPLHGLQVDISVVPYRLFMLQRLQSAFAACEPDAQAAVRQLMRESGLEQLLDARARRRVERRENREVWGARQEPAAAAHGARR
jgi:glutathione S-transferase